jgi:hypothetical protein
MDINAFIQHIKKSVTNASQSLENAKTIEPSIGGFAKNAGANALQLVLGIPQQAIQAYDLQQKYGTPNQLAVNDPTQYTKIMSSPAVNYVKHLASYSTEKIYKNPVTTTLDILALMGVLGGEQMRQVPSQALSKYRKQGVIENFLTNLTE